MPLVVTDEDREQLAQKVIKAKGTSFATKLLEDIFEVSPGEGTYDQDLNTVIDSLLQR